MRIFVNTPDYTKPSSGGVASFYYGMLGYWNENVKYNVVGRRHGLSGAVWLFWDIIKFVSRLLLFRPNCIIVNPSLKMNALRRDFLFARIGKTFGFKTVIIMHGFDLDVAKYINSKWVSDNLNKASLIFTLADRFRSIMREWGVTTPILLTTTKVEDRMINSFDINSRDGNIHNILFLSRVEKAKGVYDIIDTFKLLKARHKDLTLTIVGDGSELNSLKKYTWQNNVDSVAFMGGLNGDARIKAYIDAQLFFFPSSYGEGMPTVVLEAMAFGLPVITRNVGGLCDFFEDGNMGRITDSHCPTDFAEMIEQFLDDKNLTRQVAIYNHEYASRHFMASKVGASIENSLKKYLQ